MFGKSLYLSLIAVCLIGALASAADITADPRMLLGHWYASQYGWEMELKEDGSYVFAQSVGTYWTQGNMIYFKDATSGIVTPYSWQISGDALRFLDVNSVPIDFIRVLPQAGGYQLTQNDINAYIDVLQFIINQPLSNFERQELTEQLIEEFQTYPQQFITDSRSLAETRDKMYQITDPIQIGLIRQSLVVAFYKATKDTLASELPLFIQLMNRYVQVLAFDETNDLILTNKDLDALLEYSAFIYQLNTGEQLNWTYSAIESTKTDVLRRFPTLSQEEKQFYCSMSIIWGFFRYIWEMASVIQRSQIAQNLFSGSQLGAPGAGIDYSYIQPQESLSYAGGGEMDDSTFETLKYCMMLDHASTMNVFSSIGDSPYYYDVVDVDEY